MQGNKDREIARQTHHRMLMRRAQDGEVGAFGELCEDMSPDINRFVLTRTGFDPELAEDLAQDVWLKAFRGVQGYREREGASVRTWLYQIARNHIIDTRRRALPEADDIQSAFGLEDSSANSSHFEKQIEDRDELEPAMGRLTRDQRKAIELRFVDGYSVAETAEKMQKGYEAVKKLQDRGLAAMRRGLDAEKLGQEDIQDLTPNEYKLALLLFPAETNPRGEVSIKSIAETLGLSIAWVIRYRIKLFSKLWSQEDSQGNPDEIPPIMSVLLQRLDSIPQYAGQSMAEREKVMWNDSNKPALRRQQSKISNNA